MFSSLKREEKKRIIRNVSIKALVSIELKFLILYLSLNIVINPIETYHHSRQFLTSLNPLKTKCNQFNWNFKHSFGPPFYLIEEPTADDHSKYSNLHKSSFTNKIQFIVVVVNAFSPKSKSQPLQFNLNGLFDYNCCCCRLLLNIAQPHPGSSLHKRQSVPTRVYLSFRPLLFIENQFVD